MESNPDGPPSPKSVVIGKKTGSNEFEFRAHSLTEPHQERIVEWEGEREVAVEALHVRVVAVALAPDVVLEGDGRPQLIRALLEVPKDKAIRALRGNKQASCPLISQVVVCRLCGSRSRSTQRGTRGFYSPNFAVETFVY